MAVKSEGLATLHAGQSAEHGNRSLAVGYLHFGHAISVFLVEVDDSLEDAGDGLVVLDGVRHQVGT